MTYDGEARADPQEQADLYWAALTAFADADRVLVR